MKSFSGKKPFSGLWEKDLVRTLSIYETMAAMYKVSEEEKLKGVEVMLSGDTLYYCLTKVKEWSTYQDAINSLRVWYNNTEACL